MKLGTEAIYGSELNQLMWQDYYSGLVNETYFLVAVKRRQLSAWYNEPIIRASSAGSKQNKK